MLAPAQALHYFSQIMKKTLQSYGPLFNTLMVEFGGSISRDGIFMRTLTIVHVTINEKSLEWALYIYKGGGSTSTELPSHIANYIYLPLYELPLFNTELP